jgi:amino acid adenylation domain-containing protein
MSTMTPTLIELIDAAARQWPERIAVEDLPDGRLTYRELDVLSRRVQRKLRELGVRRGDRVGIYMRKSIDALAAILGLLRAGAAYVPVDASAPPARAAYILADCGVRVIVLESNLEDAVVGELTKLGATPALIRLGTVGAGRGLTAALGSQETGSDLTVAPEPITADDLAYILYTSGSTGKPKGVMLSHRNATSFVQWCAEVFQPTPEDIFSSHAPLHFDLSILDLYVPLTHGARVVLIGADDGKDPIGLAQLISQRKITVWYSTPSVLSLLAQYGKLDRHDFSALRTVLFAGEVFAVKHLRTLQQYWPQPRYFNLYGPTETNVCTFYEVTERVPAERTEPYPIGIACSHLRTRVVDEQGADVEFGGEGELVVNGAGVMQGYWNLPENTARAFLIDEFGERWYRTGDIVIESNDGNYIFRGRRDRMVKRRGYRIELAEIEAGLYRHPAIKEAAVVAVRDQDSGVLIKAFLSCHNGQSPSLIELKRFCAEALPIYMVPDQFAVQDILPKTSTDKIDYQRLLGSV